MVPHSVVEFSSVHWVLTPVVGSWVAPEAGLDGGAGLSWCLAGGSEMGALQRPRGLREARDAAVEHLGEELPDLLGVVGEPVALGRLRGEHGVPGAPERLHRLPHHPVPRAEVGGQFLAGDERRRVGAVARGVLPLDAPEHLQHPALGLGECLVAAADGRGEAGPRVRS